jgi:hypothetical protein
LDKLACGAYKTTYLRLIFKNFGKIARKRPDLLKPALIRVGETLGELGEAEVLPQMLRLYQQAAKHSGSADDIRAAAELLLVYGCLVKNVQLSVGELQTEVATLAASYTRSSGTAKDETKNLEHPLRSWADELYRRHAKFACAHSEFQKNKEGAACRLACRHQQH